jgi:hypothetical protein
VTRLGEFSPIGQLFSWGIFFENCRSTTLIFGLLFPQLCIDLVKKMDWFTFWAIFSQNHLVTLYPVNKVMKEKG